MRVLMVKMSSLGDVIHTLPALTDAKLAIPEIQFDWVVEESFAEIPAWHASVNKVIPISLRRWRKQKMATLKSGEFGQFLKNLRAEKYDAIIDAQGLLKSALSAKFARGKVRYGYDANSSRGKGIAWLYQKTATVSKRLHAIERIRRLMALSLGYDMPATSPDYGIAQTFANNAGASAPYLVFLHGTTWDTKLWPEKYWHELASLALDSGFEVRLTTGNPEEYARAERIADKRKNITVLPRFDLLALGKLLNGAAGVVGVDTGLGHLAAALNKPAVAIYGATDPVLTSTCGAGQVHLKSDINCAPCLQRQCTHPEQSKLAMPPCYQMISPERVFSALQENLI